MLRSVRSRGNFSLRNLARYPSRRQRRTWWKSSRPGVRLWGVSLSLRMRVVGRCGAAACTISKTRATACFASTCINRLLRLTICVPMMAQGEALGILHLGYQEVGRLTESKQRFAVAVAEHVALALSNLKLHETLRSQSIRDPLTGLFNRRFMEESLIREVLRAARNQGPLGVIMIDLDGFKSFNDTFGHDAGDTLLRELGFLLRNNIRAEDIACRYGGEEFTLVLPEATLEATLERAEQIREEIKRLKVLHRDQDLGQVTVSLGVAVFPNHGTTGEALLRAADTALYRAKIDGRDRVAV